MFVLCLKALGDEVEELGVEAGRGRVVILVVLVMALLGFGVSWARKMKVSLSYCLPLVGLNEWMEGTDGRPNTSPS